MCLSGSYFEEEVMLMNTQIEAVPKKLWVDDIRPVPDASWFVARSFHEAICMLEKGDFSIVSLDHDLASFYGYKEMTGMDILQWMERRQYDGIVIPATIHIHTGNASVKQTMLELAKKLMDTEAKYANQASNG